MEKEFEERLNKYLKDNGVDVIPTDNKIKLELLKNIVFKSKVDLDVLDLINTKNRNKGIIDSEFLPKIQNLEINVENGTYYIINVKGIVKEERKLERKAKIKKFLKLK